MSVNNIAIWLTIVNMNESNFQKMFLKIIGPLLVYYLVNLLCRKGIDLLLIAQGFPEGMDALNAGSASCINGICMTAGGLALIPCIRADRLFSRTGSGSVLNGIGSFLLALLTGASMAIFFNMLILYSGISRFSREYAHAVRSLYAVDIAAGVVLYALVAPIVEEILFRGILYGRLKSYAADGKAAIVASALLFGLYHGNLVQGIYGFLIGGLFALLYEWSGSLWIPMVLHGAANLCIYLLNTIAPKSLYGAVFSLSGTIFSFILLGVCLLFWHRIKKSSH